MLKIQCNMAGYNSNRPVTILATLENDILTIAKQVDFKEERIKPEFALVGNIGIELDYTFTDKDFSSSIENYFDKSGRNKIFFDKTVEKYRPDSRIEIDKIDSTGKSYRLDQSIENGQIAILALTAFAKKQAGIMSVLDYGETEKKQYSESSDFFSI